MKISGTKNTANRKIVLSIVAILLVLTLTALGCILIYQYREEALYRDLKEYQSEMLEILDEQKGQYDDRSIVLYDTNEREAKELAELWGAKLRITANGKFATLTLEEGVNIVDIFSNDEYLEILKSLSADWSASITDLENGDEDEDNAERTPQRPDYPVRDILYDYQKYLDYLNLKNSWYYFSGYNTTIAIIDTGIDTDNPEFSGRISAYSYNASEDKIVKDYTDENGNYDWSLIEDEQGHGTAVAGVIAASDNRLGIVGIAPNTQILVIKVECDENATYRSLGNKNEEKKFVPID